VIEDLFLQPGHLISVLGMHSEFGIGLIFSDLCRAMSALSTSINTDSISSTVAGASPAAWLDENYTSLFSLHPRISAVDWLHRHTWSLIHSVDNLYSLSPRYLCELCPGHLCALSLGIVMHYLSFNPLAFTTFWGGCLVVVPGRGVCGGVRSANQLKVTR
jgi:hypothetical protein